MSAILSCRGVSKRFGSTVAVDGVDLDVEAGSIFALLGPSGCGKTTLLRMVAGFEAPDAGEIELSGRLLAGRSGFVQPEKRRVAMVFQDFALFPHMDVAANVAFGLAKGEDRGRRVAQLLELTGLAGLERRLPHELSGGQQQRVALARALAPSPTLLLLDEPFSNLDPVVRQRVRGEVKQLIQSVGITAVFVTHDQEEALSLADGVAVMMEGRLLQTGTPALIYAEPNSRAVAEFVGGANFLPGEALGDSVRCELGLLPSTAGFSGAATVVLRPEDLALSEDGVPAEVISIEYFGHDQMLTLRLASGAVLKVRLLSAPVLQPGQRVGVGARSAVRAFPADA